MKTALIFILVILCGLTLCARKNSHLDYKTTDVAYPLTHKPYFDFKYKTSGVADSWRHKKYIDFEDRSTDISDPWRHKKSINLEDRATDVADPARCFWRYYRTTVCRRVCPRNRCCRIIIQYYLYRWHFRYYYYWRRIYYCRRCYYTVLRSRRCIG